MPLSETIEGNLRLSPGLFELQCSLDPWWWAQKKGVRLVSSPFTYEGMEFQYKPMTERPPVKVICKATQMGFTEAEVLRVLHGMIYDYYPTGVYYLHPNKEKVSEFSKSRFNPLIKDNPDTIGQYVKDTDSATLKRIGSGFLFFRSGRLHQDIKGEMKSAAALKGDTADHAVHDEYDEMDPGVDEFVDGRLAKSPIRTKSYLANPTIPDYGIDKKFQQSNQEYWHIKCLHCGRYTCLDDGDNFPNLFHERADGSVIRACSNPRCGRPLDPRWGEWVAKRRDITDILGFTIGHPSAYWIDPKKLLHDYLNPECDIANFTRLKLGRAYIEAENRLSEDEILALCGTNGIASSDRGPCFMGVDQGGGTRDLLHVVIGKRDLVKKARIIHIGYYKGWEELDRLLKMFHVRRCVVDGLPNTDDARKFAYRNKGKVYLSYFNENQKGYYKWNEKEYTVTSNRTEALDYSHKELANGDVILPRRTKEIELFAFHCHNIAKKLEEDEVTGSKRYVYIKLGGKDHYRFAFNYESMARIGAPGKMFEGA